MARYTGKKIRLGEALVLSNAITEEQLQQALEEQKTSGKKLGELLIDKGLITEDLIAQILGAQLGYPIIDLSNITISPDVQNLVPSSVLKKSQVLPIEFAEDNINILRVAMADPLDVNAMDDISIITGCQIEPLIATPRSVMVAIDKFYGSDEVASALEEYAKEKFGDDDINEEINDDINNSPIVVLVKEMIEKAARQRASDIHIEPMEKSVRVRYRIDGALYEKGKYDIKIMPALSARIKIIGGMDISEKRKPQDGRITQMVDRLEYDIRVSVLPTVYGEKIVMRLASKTALNREKSKLGFRPEEMKRFDHILKNPHGIILVTGPTGSGKSVLLNFLASQFRSVPKARIYVFDKGASSRVFAAAVKGNFYDLGNDDSANNLAFQPLRYIDDENEKVWASEWLQELFVQEGVEMNPEKRKAIWDALTSVAATPPDERTLTAIKLFVQNMELRDALEPFVVETKGIADTAGAYGKLFDSDIDSLKLGSYQSFEMGELMSKKNAVMPTLLYLFHVIEKNCDGSPTFIILDECWTFLDNPIFAEKIREWLKTMRKNNVSIIFATQNLEDIKKCSISSAIIESCMTRFFLPNAQALNQGNEEVYGFFNLNYRERQIIADSRPKHDYYIVSAEGKRRFDLALSPYALSILAASSKDDQAECERIKKSYPDDDFMVHWLEYKGLRDAKEAYMSL